MSTEYIDPADCPRDTMYRGVVRGRTHILRRVSPGEPKPWIAILSDWDYSEHDDGEVSHLVEVGTFPPPSDEPPPKGTATPEEVEKILKREMGRIRPETIELKSENARRVAEIIDHEGFGSGGTLGELVAARLEEEGLISPYPLVKEWATIDRAADKHMWSDVAWPAKSEERARDAAWSFGYDVLHRYRTEWMDDYE